MLMLLLPQMIHCRMLRLLPLHRIPNLRYLRRLLPLLLQIQIHCLKTLLRQLPMPSHLTRLQVLLRQLVSLQQLESPRLLDVLVLKTRLRLLLLRPTSFV